MGIDFGFGNFLVLVLVEKLVEDFAERLEGWSLLLLGGGIMVVVVVVAMGGDEEGK